MTRPVALRPHCGLVKRHARECDVAQVAAAPA